MSALSELQRLSASARCVELGMSPDPFFDRHHEDHVAAKQACAECVVTEMCRATAGNRDFGLWGGEWIPVEIVHSRGAHSRSERRGRRKRMASVYLSDAKLSYVAVAKQFGVHHTTVIEAVREFEAEMAT